jgi:hypothetical protein
MREGGGGGERGGERREEMRLVDLHITVNHCESLSLTHYHSLDDFNECSQLNELTIEKRFTLTYYTTTHYNTLHLPPSIVSLISM